jgi:hypothetical protein
VTQAISSTLVCLKDALILIAASDKILALLCSAEGEMESPSEVTRLFFSDSQDYNHRASIIK